MLAAGLEPLGLPGRIRVAPPDVRSRVGRPRLMTGLPGWVNLRDQYGDYRTRQSHEPPVRSDHLTVPIPALPRLHGPELNPFEVSIGLGQVWLPVACPDDRL